MQKYGDAGERFLSLDINMKLKDENITGHDIITYEDNDLLDGGRAAIITSFAEQLIKDAAYKLLRDKKINKVALEVFLHSHGIDEFWPPKTAEEIYAILGPERVERYNIKIIRYKAAKKIRREITDVDS